MTALKVFRIEFQPFDPILAAVSLLLLVEVSPDVEDGDIRTRPRIDADVRAPVLGVE